MEFERVSYKNIKREVNLRIIHLREAEKIDYTAPLGCRIPKALYGVKAVGFESILVEIEYICPHCGTLFKAA